MVRTIAALSLLALVTLGTGTVAGRAAAATGPSAVLPAASAVPGWKQIGAVRTYNRSNLFELIDGEAESINSYAFTNEAHAEFGAASQSRPSITVDVFDVTDPLNAFGLFSSDRSSGKPVPIGTEGVLIGTTGLNFWKGRYVVRLAIVERSPSAATRAALDKLARATAAKITGAGGPPSLVQALPPGRQPRSEKYTLKNAAGHAFVNNAISARYPSLGQGAELFIAQYANPPGAKSAMDAFKKYEATGTGMTPLKGMGESGFSVVDKYAKNVVVAQKGRYLVFIVRAKDPATAQNLVRQAVAKVK